MCQTLDVADLAWEPPNKFQFVPLPSRFSVLVVVVVERRRLLYSFHAVILIETIFI